MNIIHDYKTKKEIPVSIICKYKNEDSQFCIVLFVPVIIGHCNCKAVK